jgi:hypothetical protein
MVILKRQNGEFQQFNEFCPLDEVAIILTGEDKGARFIGPNGQELNVSKNKISKSVKKSDILL